MSSRDRCKVDATIEKYDLDAAEMRYETIDERLLARWIGADGRSSSGYRPLTEWFNKRLLKRIYDEHGRDTIGIRLESEYETLTGDDDIRRREVADDLRMDGIDPDELRSDMVSWSTMRHHLKGCLDAEKEPQTAMSDWEETSVRIAQERTHTKVEEALRSLVSKGRLPGGDEAQIDVQVQLSCPECPVRVPLTDALSRGYICKTHLGSLTTSSPSA